ncbi:MAG: LptF/LptG family permease [Bacteroidetes bacterium]|jgi:lipopolysaccharide export system permease protein|nr:LptF/LptG family permease [Bacteroidota bacterium]
MLNHVQRDLLKKHVGPFLFCFITVMFILLMQFLILHVDKLVGKGLPFLIVIELIINNLAYMVVLAAPMAVLVSTLMAYGRFSEWNELTAIRAAGINPIKLILPVAGAGFLLFLFMGYFSNYVLPEANHKARSLFIDIRTQKPAFDLKESTFYDELDGYTFISKEVESETDSLFDVRVFQEPTDGRHRAIITAQKGWLTSPDEITLSLHLIDGSILRYIPGEAGNRETLEKSTFDRYRMSFDLADLSFSRSNPNRRSRTDRTMSAQAMMAVIDSLQMEKETDYRRLQIDLKQNEYLPFNLETTTVFTLTPDAVADTARLYHSEYSILNEMPNPTAQLESVNRAITAIDRYRPHLADLESNHSWKDSRIAEFMIEVHKKLSLPFACVIFVLLGAPIGMLTRKGNLGFAAIVSSVLLTIYFIAVIQGEKLADRMLISPFMGMWAINFLYLFIGFILVLHVSTPLRITKLFRRNEKA